MDIIHSIILGAVEGVSEFLPISSTGHLILAGKLLGLESTDFQKSFNIAIQLGAILSVVVLYWQRFLLDRKAMINVIAAFIPTAAIGFVFYKSVKSMLGSEMIVVWSLLIGGIFMIAFERWHKGKDGTVRSVSEMTIKQSVIIGLVQSISMIPGVSRSASTIFGGLFLGLTRKTAVEFSFLLAVPVMAAATGLDLLKNYKNFSSADAGALGVGFIVSFIVALASIKFLLSYINKHDFTGFGIYRIIAALVFLFLLH